MLSLAVLGLLTHLEMVPGGQLRNPGKAQQIPNPRKNPNRKRRQRRSSHPRKMNMSQSMIVMMMIAMSKMMMGLKLMSTMLAARRIPSSGLLQRRVPPRSRPRSPVNTVKRTAVCGVVREKIILYWVQQHGVCTFQLRLDPWLFTIWNCGSAHYVFWLCFSPSLFLINSVNTPFLDMLQEDLPSESLPFEYAIEKKHEYAELGP